MTSQVGIQITGKDETMAKWDREVIEIIKRNPDGVSPDMILNTLGRNLLTESVLSHVTRRLIGAGRMYKHGRGKAAMFIPLEESPSLGRLSEVSRGMMRISTDLNEVVESGNAYPGMTLSTCIAAKNELEVLAKELREATDQLSAQVKRMEEENDRPSVSDGKNESEVLVPGNGTGKESVLGVDGGGEREQ